MSGPEPRLAGRARALEGERPRVEVRPLRDQPRRLEQLVAIRVVHVEDPGRKAVRREDDVRVGPAHAVGEHGEVRLVHVPALDEAQPGAPVERVLEPLAVAVDGQRRVVRREHEADDRVGAALDRAVDGLGDPRRPVLHARVDREAELALQPCARPLGHVVERRAPADPPVALRELLDRLVGHRPARADVLEIRPDVREVGRAPVGHQHDRRLHAAVRSWTSSTMRLRSAGSVSGSTPWPRLKMWPGRPPAASRIADRRRLDAREGPEQQRGIEVPLHAAIAADPLPPLVEPDAPVEADHVAPGLGHRLEQVRGAGSEVDRRHVDGVEDSFRIRRDELLVVVAGEGADPGVEELNRIRARLDGRAQIGLRGHGELLAQRVPDLGRAVHAALRDRELTRRPALDEVARDRERAAAEADERLLGSERGAHEPHRVEDERHGLFRVGHTQALHVRHRPHRLRDDRPHALDEIDVDAHPEDRKHDVREHHRRVDAVRAHRLERDLRAELRLAADLEQRVPLPDLAVAGQRPPGLAHEPDRRPLDGLLASRSDQQRCHYNWAASWSSMRRKRSDATASAAIATPNA